jgi:hypothetical protein
LQEDDRRMEELEDMRDSGYKVELEALNWLGGLLFGWVSRNIFGHQDQVEAGNDDGRRVAGNHLEYGR